MTNYIANEKARLVNVVKGILQLQIIIVRYNNCLEYLLC